MSGQGLTFLEPLERLALQMVNFLTTSPTQVTPIEKSISKI